MKLKTQFDLYGCQTVVSVEYPSEMYEPIPGFVPGVVRPLGELVRLLSLGQNVPVSLSGVYEDEQFLDDYSLDNFDVLDRIEDFEQRIEQKTSVRNTSYERGGNKSNSQVSNEVKSESGSAIKQDASPAASPPEKEQN